MRDGSPEDAEDEIPTDADDDFVVSGGKRIPLDNYDPRCVIR
jgi:hypothetical protein